MKFLIKFRVERTARVGQLKRGKNKKKTRKIRTVMKEHTASKVTRSRNK